MIGALTSGKLMQYGRRKLLIIASLISIVGVGITLVTNEIAICVGRLIWGLGCGVYSVVIPRYMDEIIPPYLLSKYGILVNSAGMFGEMLAMLMGAILPKIVYN